MNELYIQNIQDLPSALNKLEIDGGEFLWSDNFNPYFISELCRNGFYPMGHRINNQDILLIKMHIERCILNFNKLHKTNNFRRYSKGLTLKINHNFPQCLDKIRKFHPDNWINESLSEAVSFIHNSESFRTKFHSVELYDDDELAAGEIGFTNGAVYSSFSGFHTKNGSGTVQLCLLAEKLHAAGFSFMDLGMEMDYKTRLGAELLERKEFLKLFYTEREKEAQL